jgi:hypothetical protein
MADNTAPVDRFTIVDAPPTPAERLAELRLTLPRSFRYDLETLFPKTTRAGWQYDMRRRHRRLRSAEPVLRLALADSETIEYITHGVRHTWLETLVFHIWAPSLNQLLVVITNVRIILIRTNRLGDPQRTFWTLFHHQITGCRMRWNNILTIRLVGGETLKFSGFSRTDRRMIRQLIEDGQQLSLASRRIPETTRPLETLCSYCLTPVPADEYRCAICRTDYWRPSQLAWRSMIFPSWGDFLMGHTEVALIEIIGALFSWSVLLGALARTLQQGSLLPLMVALPLFLIANGFDAFITAHIAKKGLHPRGIPRRKLADSLKRPV